MNIIPVIDLLNGVVVRGIAGERNKYRPIHSLLAASADPSIVLNGLQEAFNFQQFYLADLDAIQFQRLNRCTIAELCRSDVSWMVDRGVRSVQDAEELLDLGVEHVVVALESLSGPDLAKELIRKFGPERLVMSLDLKQSNLVTPCEAWVDLQPMDLAVQVADFGFRQFIVLDLAAVGTGEGIPTLRLCHELRAIQPEMSLITGGGVRGVDDLRDAQSAGVDSVLIASALHDGRLTPEDLTNILE